MYKKQMLAQKIIVMATLLACAFAFLASLGFLTGAYEVLYPGISQRGDKFAGCRLYEEFQPINRSMTNASIVLIVVCLLLFITGCNTRRRYYASNYVASILVPGINIGFSIKCILDANLCKTRFLTETDFVKLKELAESPTNTKYVYSESTFWYDLAIIAFVIVIIMSLLVIINMVLKIILMNGEKKLLETSKEVYSS